MAGRLDVVLSCRSTRPSRRVVVDRADVGDQSRQGDGGGAGQAAKRSYRWCLQVGQLLAQGKILQRKVRAGTERGSQRSKEAHDQGSHRAMMHDGKLPSLAWLPVIATVGKKTERMTSWRGTAVFGLIISPSVYSPAPQPPGPCRKETVHRIQKAPRHLLHPSPVGIHRRAADLHRPRLELDDHVDQVSDGPERSQRFDREEVAGIQRFEVAPDERRPSPLSSSFRRWLDADLARMSATAVRPISTPSQFRKQRRVASLVRYGPQPVVIAPSTRRQGFHRRILARSVDPTQMTFPS